MEKKVNRNISVKRIYLTHLQGIILTYTSLDTKKNLDFKK